MGQAILASLRPRRAAPGAGIRRPAVGSGCAARARRAARVADSNARSQRSSARVSPAAAARSARSRAKAVSTSMKVFARARPASPGARKVSAKSSTSLVESVSLCSSSAVISRAGSSPSSAQARAAAGLAPPSRLASAASSALMPSASSVGRDRRLREGPEAHPHRARARACAAAPPPRCVTSSITAPGGGSSSVFRSAFAASVRSRSACGIRATRRPRSFATSASARSSSRTPSTLIQAPSSSTRCRSGWLPVASEPAVVARPAGLLRAGWARPCTGAAARTTRPLRACPCPAGPRTGRPREPCRPRAHAPAPPRSLRCRRAPSVSGRITLQPIEFSRIAGALRYAQ